MSDIYRLLNDHLPGKELFIRFTARAFRKLLSIYVFIISLLVLRVMQGCPSVAFSQNFANQLLKNAND